MLFSLSLAPRRFDLRHVMNNISTLKNDNFVSFSIEIFSLEP